MLTPTVLSAFLPIQLDPEYIILLSLKAICKPSFTPFPNILFCPDHTSPAWVDLPVQAGSVCTNVLQHLLEITRTSSAHQGALTLGVCWISKG